jgi:hypothetical protein
LGRKSTRNSITPFLDSSADRGILPFPVLAGADPLPFLLRHEPPLPGRNVQIQGTKSDSLEIQDLVTTTPMGLWNMISRCSGGLINSLFFILYSFFKSLKKIDTDADSDSDYRI